MTDTNPAPEQQMMPSLRERAVIERGLAMDATSLVGINSVFSNGTAFQLATRMAEMLANSTIMPESYQGNPSNCLIAVDYAARLHTSPVMLAQNMDVVKGRPGLRGTFLAGIINASPLFSRLKYEWQGDPGKNGGKPSGDYGCRAYATEVETGEVLYGTWITWAMVTGEKWDSNAKWTHMREQMFMYRAASFWSRAHASDVTLGLYESEELHDMDPAPRRSVRALAATELAENQGFLDRLTQRAADPIDDAEAVSVSAGSDEPADAAPADSAVPLSDPGAERASPPPPAEPAPGSARTRRRRGTIE